MALKEKNGELVFVSSGAMFLIVGLIAFGAGIYLAIYPSEEDAGFAVLIPIVIGAVFVLTWNYIKLTISRTRITSRIRGIFVRKMNTYNASEIVSVEYNDYEQDKENFKLKDETKVGYNHSANFKLFLCFKDGTYIGIPLSYGTVKTSGFLSIMARNNSSRKYIEAGQQIASFLNVQFVERRAPTIGEALKVIKNTVEKSIEDARK